MDEKRRTRRHLERMPALPEEIVKALLTTAARIDERGLSGDDVDSLERAGLRLRVEMHPSEPGWWRAEVAHGGRYAPVIVDEDAGNAAARAMRAAVVHGFTLADAGLGP